MTEDRAERQARRAEGLEDALALHRADSPAEQFRVSLSIERRKLADLADDQTLRHFLAANPADVVFDKKLFAELLDEAEQWASAGNYEDALSRLEGVGIMVGSVSEALALWNARRVRETTAQKKRAGSAPKRRGWAEIVAAKIKHQGRTKDQCLNSLPEYQHEGLEIDGDHADLKVWRDGDTIMCIESGDRGETSRRMKQSNFKKRYLGSGQ